MGDEEVRGLLVDQVKEDTGLTIMRFDVGGGAPRGFIYKGEPTRTPDGLRGLKLRTTGSPIEIALFETLGINGQTIDYTELYSSMQQNMIDGTYLQPSFVADSKLQETADVFINPMLSWETITHVVGQNAIDKLGPELTQVVMECAVEAEAYTDQLWEEENAKARAAMEDKIIVIDDLTDNELNLWQEAVEPVWDKLVGTEVSEEFLNKVLAVEH